MAEFEVRIKAEHMLTFTVNADSAGAAAHEAVASLYDGNTPETEEVVRNEVVEVKNGDFVIDLTWLFDYGAPKDSNGLTPWKCVAYVDGKRIAEGHDLIRVLDGAECGRRDIRELTTEDV